MPVLSSFISYRPKRKTKAPIQVSSPFPVETYNPGSSPYHPYASPPIIDINDGREPGHSRKVPEQGGYYGSAGTPRVELNVEIDPEPLTDWFPTNFFNPDPAPPTSTGATATASGNGDSNGAGSNVAKAGASNGNFATQGITEGRVSMEDEDYDEDELYTLSSAEEVLANLEAMDASNFVGQFGSDRVQESQHLGKKPAPTPIKIPNAALHGPKVQVIRSAELSRPTSQISSPESSAISGTTLARALLANTFVLSGETRASRYRSGGSTLTRVDSATLPRGEYSFVHSPHWRDTTSSDIALSPGSAPPEPVPPIPPNAEQVYVPPRTTRQSTDARERRRPSTSGSAQLEQPEAGPSGKQHDDDSRASRRMSRITEATSSQSSTPQLAYTLPEAVQERPRSPLAAPKPPPPPVAALSDRDKSRRYSLKPETETASEGTTSPLPDAPTSAKDLDNVLDYYSFADTPEPTVERNFRLPFSPITEESSSQLSPPTPYNRPDSRGSKSSLPAGRFFLGSAPSASINGVRVDWNVRNSGRRDSTSGSSKPLLPIGDRPGNQSSSNSSTHPRANQFAASSSTTAREPANSNHLPLPASSVFSRLRSGSAPSPIKVVRDSRDLTAYNITVTPRTNESAGTTPTTGDSDIIQQTFPETPSAFSPGFSPNGIASPGMRGSSAMGEYMSMAAPASPMSALLPAPGNIQPSLAQQVLLTRAATSVHGARHSRQASLTRLMRQQGHPYARPSSTVMRETSAAEDRADVNNVASSGKADAGASHKTADDGAGPVPPTRPLEVQARTEAKTPTINGVQRTQAELSVEKPLPEETAPSPVLAAPPFPATSQPSSPPEPPAPTLGTVSLPATTPTPPTQTPLPPKSPARLPTTPSSLSHSSEEAVLAYDGGAFEHDSLENGRAPSRAASKRSNASTDSQRAVAKTHARTPSAAPRIPPAPTVSPPAAPPPPPPPVEPSASVSKEGLSSPSVPPLTQTSAPLTSRREDASPSPRMAPVQNPAPVVNAATSNPSTVTGTPTARRPGVINPPPPQLQLPPPEPSASSLYSLSYDAALSPPSYYAVINSDRAAGEAITPGTSASYDPNYRFGTPFQPQSPPPNGGEFVVGSSTDRAPSKSQAPSSTNPRRPRARPPLPAGPRRPSQQHNSMASSVMRERGGSVSSVASQMPSSRRVHAAPLPSPRFQTPVPKWRGYTMDAAKWTFTSAQLQAIVSRAIRQSSEASSIRLLRLETLDNEIPPEVERLETVRTDTKMKYKALARRRMCLLDSLANSVDGLDQDGPAHALQLIENLKDVTGAMDKLTEELHSVDEQLAQLNQLCQAHSTSALAMALRKLNASFLKQFAEAQELRQRMETLEAERDEAWREAQHVAHEFEELKTGKLESPDAENRFDRVMAIRKSSIRATKAGLRSINRANQRASTGSSIRGLGANTPSSARTTYMDEAPPVPPIPRRRPVEIMTNLPLRSSTVTGPSTEGPTPNSETRAMVRAQEELYEMLGIPMNDHRSRRTRSVLGVPGESDLSQQVASPMGYPQYEVPPNTGRRASLPGSAALPPDPYNAWTADVSLILNSDRSGWI
ncbi:hypothetical protein LshimejAT787_0704250 [Lyophyllum shimeji]|uniref:Uncharacterized protein n=1 Tax=Lyophyllum shimeji TaxID=47721 RepID=A0A9P3PNW9_LYOSH|nr:hypothetical protein LshimejAT787_0704250 [Lyophyllum shimeji]